MKQLAGKVAVITGAASGIGKALAERFAAEGTAVVLADMEQAALRSTEAALRATGASILAVQTDVSDYAQVQRLAAAAVAAFGAVHILCNNAGVIDMADRPVWETPLAGLRWVMDVNVWGVVHGLHVFVPIMLAQGNDCHIVNTASIAGLLSDGHYGLYNATKHAVVALSETAHLALVEQDARVKVSVLCPGFVDTRLVEAERNRPPAMPADSEEVEQRRRARIDAMRAVLRSGMAPERVAGLVVDAVRDERFYILPHPEFKPGIEARMQNILQERNPA